MKEEQNSIKEIIILIRNDRYIIKNETVEHYEGKDIIKLQSRDNIKQEEFEEIKSIILENTNQWKEEYLNKNIENKDWSIIIKYFNNNVEEYSGYEQFPESWDSFMEKIIILIERINTIKYDFEFIKILIFYKCYVKDVIEFESISNCIDFIYSDELFTFMYNSEKSKKIAESFEGLTDIGYLKLLVEAKKILEFYVKKYPEKNDSKELLELKDESSVENYKEKIEEFVDTIENSILHDGKIDILELAQI